MSQKEEQTVEKMFAKILNHMESMESVHAQFRSEIQALNSKFESIVLKDSVDSFSDAAHTSKKLHRGNRVAFGGGEEAQISCDHIESGSPEFKFEHEFGKKSSRLSLGSTSSQNSKDVGTKLERPKFTVEKSFTKDGVKTELVQDSDYLNFLDDYEHYIDQWKTIPSNEGMSYPNEAKVAVVSIPPKYARKIANRIHWIYDTKELATFGSVKQLKSAKFWSDIDSETLRIEIGKLVESELSTKGVLETIRKVRWNSSFGIIDHLAFANFQHDFKRTVLRLQSGGVIKVEHVHLKDYLISALPDKQLQNELTAKYGQTGVIIGDLETFAINNIFDDIEFYIQSISKLNLGRMVNKQNRDREAASAKGKFFQITADDDVDLDSECEEETQNSVNMLQSHSGAVKCRHEGLGSDGKVKCKWLGGPEASCVYKHPELDLKMKGKGQSQDVQKSKVTQATTHTRKVNHVETTNTSSEDEDS